MNRLQVLTQIAWAALIQSQPTANPASLAVKALELAKAMLETEEKAFGKAS